jgi:hypothetical protein
VRGAGIWTPDHRDRRDRYQSGEARYWKSVYRRYGVAGPAERRFLVADVTGRVVGFVIGEVRDWEFGSARVGLQDRRRARFASGRYRRAPAGNDLLPARRRQESRTMLSRDGKLICRFRSQGMMAGPFIPRRWISTNRWLHL